MLGGGLNTGSNAFGDLSGKVVVVAGAGNPPAEGHGIGAYTSLVMARQGVILRGRMSLRVGFTPGHCREQARR